MQHRSVRFCLIVAVLLMALASPLVAAKRRAVRLPPAPPPEPTSFALIDFALSTGQIDRDSAYLYKVYSTFGDDRLPQRFRSGVPGPPDTFIMVEVAGVYDTLSPATQALLDPFFIPPIYKGSWYDMREAADAPKTSAAGPLPGPCDPSTPWSVVADPAGAPYPVRLWWDSRRPQDGVELKLLAPKVSRLWAAVAAVYGTQPVDDFDLSRPNCRGGDGRPDIMLVPMGPGDLGIPVPYAPKAAGKGLCPPRPHYTLINRDLVVNWLETTVVHELAHLFQAAFDRQAACSNYEWLDEATAQWTEEHVNPLLDLEHSAAPKFLGRPTEPLDVRDYKREYGAYLFFLYATCVDPKCTSRAPAPIRAIYNATQSKPSVDAIDASVPGHFQDFWPLFSLFNLNREPVDVYQRLDRLTDTPPIRLLGRGTVPIETELPRLSASYFYKDFSSDPTIRSIAFLNGAKYDLSRRTSPGPLAIGETVYVIDKAPPGYADTVHVRSLAKMGTTWQDPLASEVNWDKAPVAIYCHSASQPRLAESYLVFSNSAHLPGSQPESPLDLPMTLLQSNYGCAEWKGTVRNEWDALGLEATYNLTFKNGLPSGPVDEANIRMPYGIAGISYQASGTVEWKIAYTRGQCTYEGKGTLTPDALGTHLVTYNFADEGPLYRRWEMQINVSTPAKLKSGCGDIDFQLPALKILRLIPIYGELPFVDSGGTLISGTFSIGPGLEKWTVELHHQP